jgi:hypothetical protein
MEGYKNSTSAVVCGLWERSNRSCVVVVAVLRNSPGEQLLAVASTAEIPDLLFSLYSPYFSLSKHLVSHYKLLLFPSQFL